MRYYTHLYRHLIGKIPASDLQLLQQAEYEDWTQIFPEKATTPEAAQALKKLLVTKHHEEEASIDSI